MLETGEVVTASSEKCGQPSWIIIVCSVMLSQFDDTYIEQSAIEVQLRIHATATDSS